MNAKRFDQVCLNQLFLELFGFHPSVLYKPNDLWYRTFSETFENLSCYQFGLVTKSHIRGQVSKGEPENGDGFVLLDRLIN